MGSEQETKEAIESLAWKLEATESLAKSLEEKSHRALAEIAELAARVSHHSNTILTLENRLNGEAAIWKSLQKRVWAVAALAFLVGLVPSGIRWLVKDLNAAALVTQAQEAERKAKAAADTADGYAKIVSDLRERLNNQNDRATQLDKKLNDQSSSLEAQAQRQRELSQLLQPIDARTTELAKNVPDLKTVLQDVSSLKAKTRFIRTSHEDGRPERSVTVVDGPLWIQGGPNARLEIWSSGHATLHAKEFRPPAPYLTRDIRYFGELRQRPAEDEDRP